MNTKKALKDIFEHYNEELANTDDVIEDIIKIIETKANREVQRIKDMIEEYVTDDIVRSIHSAHEVYLKRKVCYGSTI